ncbi:hypothetical protein Tco_1358571, partial [Tanacetum coccineum]
KLTELMDLCTNLQKKFLDLEKAKTAQDSEIASPKKKVTLIDETQGRNDDNLMFDTGVLDEREVEVEKVVSTAEVTTESATTTTQEKRGTNLSKALKGFKFEVIKDMFDKAFKRVNTFLDYKIELVKGSEKREKDSTKRAGTELEQEVVKKQEINDAKVDDNQEEERMKELMNIVPNEEEVAIDAIPLATKPLCIVD